MKRIISVITIVFLISIAAGVVQADDGKMEDSHKGHQMMKSSSEKADSNNAQIVDAGNKTCPISGSPVNGKDYVIYKNVKYGTCCPGCDKEFLKNPEKYIKLLREKGEIK